MSTIDSAWTERARRVAQETLARHAEDVDRAGRWPAESVRALREQGFLGLALPVALGGGGQGPGTFAAVTGILAEQCASTAMIYLMHVCASQVIAAAAALASREAVLRAIAAGGHLSTLAFSEKGSRSHFWSPVSRAVVDGDCHRLTAEKSWVTSAGQADSYIVSTGSATAAGPLASTLYFVPREAPGFSVSGTWNGLGLRGNASAPMRLDGVAIPAEHRVSGDGDGFSAMLNIALPWFQIGSAAISVGIARAATAGTLRHVAAARLEHLGRQSLASFMNIRARLAQMQIAVDVHQAFVDRVAEQMEKGAPGVMLGLLEAKAAAAESALQVTELGMRSCGGAAFSRHLGVERNLRDARAAWVMAPTTDVLYDLVGRSLLDMPLFDPPNEPSRSDNGERS